MKKILFVLIALLSINSISAKQVSENEAASIASEFFHSGKGQNASKLKAMNVSLAHEFKSDDTTLMYAFNNGLDGYVLVAGDDAIVPVLGYSDNGQFDYNTLPANARSWFEMYAQMIKSIKDGKSKAIKTYPSPTSVEPLIVTKWNQDYPYWNLTPKVNGNQCLTGCPATAMAQIAYYHQWPVASEGHVDYVTESMKIHIEAELNTTFDWANMTPTYDQNSSEVSCNAVAELMREIGYAMEMDYTDDMSGQDQGHIAKGIVEHLGYDKGLRIRYAETHEEEEWVEMLKEELDAKRPILYCGFTALQEGHAFVCDGYDTDGLFHINWGWGGVSDGYFVITSLDPEAQGLGGADSGAGFNNGQLAVMSIQKPVEDSVAIPYTLVYSDGKMKVTEETIDLTLEEFGNAGYGDFEGALCCDIVTPYESVVKQFLLVEHIELPMNEASNISFSIPLQEISDLEDGNYALYLYTYDSNDSKVELETGIDPFVFNKNGDVITSLFKSPVNIVLEHRNGKVEVEDDVAYFCAEIINVTEMEEVGEDGGESEDLVYKGQIIFVIYNSVDDLVETFATEEITLEPGQGAKLQLNFSVAELPDGKYHIEMLCRDATEINPTNAPELYFEINRGSVNEVDFNDPNRVVDVVAVDGRIIKQNVKVSEASQDLAPGVYIVGNKKVVIK